LIPGHDFVNGNQVGNVSSFLKHESLELDRYLVLNAGGQFREGDEILMDYGQRSSADMLSSNGFVVEKNVYDIYKFRLILDKQDQMFKFKKLQLINKGIIDKNAGFVEINVPSDASIVPAELLEFARIQALQRNEVRQYLQRNIDGKSLNEPVSPENEKRADELLNAFFHNELQSFEEILDQRFDQPTPMITSFIAFVQTQQHLVKTIHSKLDRSEVLKELLIEAKEEEA